MGFSECRRQFSKNVGEEFSEERPMVSIRARVLSKVVSPITSISPGQAMEASVDGMKHDGQR